MRDIIRLGQVEPVRKRLSESTQSLLGDTIVLTDEQWAEPSLLPGWSRAHVATHVARGADALTHLVRARLVDRPRRLYESEASRLSDIERGSERSGLDLQIDLDTSAGALDDVLDEVTDWHALVALPVGELPLAAVTLARLHEVCIHHLDLGVGWSPARLDPVPARWLLQWAALLLHDVPALPAVEIESASGVTESFGAAGERVTVSGDDAALWAWLTGRADGASVDGADGISFPLVS